ncbi:carbohydrate sulfotransferase 11 [Photinus pyralis]|uniref:Carbohydrate sulfotransferase n=1 Tax=Photinus pyralis TaxID=7054 RepID=A0A1Y1KP93_PHOPY|nr:carbohydrate sulfotransferase 11 [Photinus pyralis]
MGYRKPKRKPSTPWKVIRRCMIFFTTICIIPVVLVLFVTSDQYLRPMRGHRLGLRPEMDFYSDGSMYLRNYNSTVVQKRLEERKRYLKQACNNFGLDIIGNDSLHKPNSWEFLVNKKYHLVWCNVFKAASTSWMYNFNLLAGYSPKFLQQTKLVPLSLARQRYPRPSLSQLKTAFNNSVSFVIVRHPFERLLSAYRDKFQFAIPHAYHRKLGMEIVEKYRPKMQKRTKWPTFPEFVMYLIDAVKNSQPLDMHWTPITEFCTPCLFDFDVIAHMETLQEDQEYIIQKANLQNVIRAEWKNPGRGSTSDQIKMYFSQLTQAQILQLYHIYRYDFELFNYSFQGYLELGKLDSDPSTLLNAINLKDVPRPVASSHAQSNLLNIVMQNVSLQVPNH